MEWDAFLSERPLAVLATVGRDGYAHAVPVEVLVRDGKVYAWVEGGSVKAGNVGRSGKASMLSYKGNAGTLVRGPARLINAEDPMYEPVSRGFLSKYEREETFGNDTLIEITPERIAVWE
ncbi:MAG TPA: pyridoxamine 5'-phosphate oxidase family protein [Actinomycetota bacterium]|nr:pyridoxamine 5'-phosphate oxidase family protein [Actinomycetota bacterium]